MKLVLIIPRKLRSVFLMCCSLCRACLGCFQSVTATERKHPAENKYDIVQNLAAPFLSPHARTHTHAQWANNTTAETVSAKSALGTKQSGFAHFSHSSKCGRMKGIKSAALGRDKLIRIWSLVRVGSMDNINVMITALFLFSKSYVMYWSKYSKKFYFLIQKWHYFEVFKEIDILDSRKLLLRAKK